jgi:glycerophosphoryl diester phosphodiesterase
MPAGKSLTPMPQIIAHRGASADAPENTLAAFRLGWEQEADGIEGDFRLSADGRIVCIHDDDTQRVAGSRLVVSETSYNDLHALDVGLWKGEQWRGERIPSLAEVLAIVPDGKQALLELKTGPEVVGPLAAVLASAPLAANQIILMSFDADVIRVCKQRLPQVKCLWLTSYKQQEDGRWTPIGDDVIATIRDLQADGLGSENRPECVNNEFVGLLRAAGVDEIHIWTVDEPRQVRHYRRLGVTSIITNRPALLRRDLDNE